MPMFVNAPIHRELCQRENVKFSARANYENKIKKVAVEDRNFRRPRKEQVGSLSDRGAMVTLGATPHRFVQVLYAHNC